MRGGFSFCGIDIADIGLEYVPENKDTYVYALAETTVHEEIFDGHNGGYTYGAYKQPKEFTLRCYYEDTSIAKGLMAKVHNLFRVGRKGMLIFKRRPWCYYYATVTAVDSSDMYNYLNGIFVVTLKAYYPFARGLPVNDHLFYNLDTDEYHDEIMENTAILDKEYMVPKTSFTNITTQKTIQLFNPGTERAKVSIVISGTAGDGVTINNKTTMQSCRYIAFTNTDGDIYTDGLNGKTVVEKNGIQELAFLYHDYGYIELEPAFPIIRELYVNYEYSTVTAYNILYEEEEEKEWYIGKYIFLGSDENGSWHKITNCVDEHTLTISGNIEEPGSCKTCVALMNEITITPTQGSSLNKLSFIYKPTFA